MASAVSAPVSVGRSYLTLANFIKINAFISGIFAGNRQLQGVRAARDERWQQEVLKRDQKIRDLEKQLNPGATSASAAAVSAEEVTKT
mmetsp:Transcript_1736/g.5253  ORF Transcript_1736/g.5253 Transcript_1736/m.5253 type:complete len:88 (+) Transcript_1736:218-481(+)